MSPFPCLPSLYHSFLSLSFFIHPSCLTIFLPVLPIIFLSCFLLSVLHFSLLSSFLSIFHAFPSFFLSCIFSFFPSYLLFVPSVSLLSLLILYTLIFFFICFLYFSLKSFLSFILSPVLPYVFPFFLPFFLASLYNFPHCFPYFVPCILIPFCFNSYIFSSHLSFLF